MVNWLYGIGLGQYASECRKHFKNGLQLLHATPQELEKVGCHDARSPSIRMIPFLQKIGMRNPLHRKKLQLCLNGLCTRQTEANILDTHWVQSMMQTLVCFSHRSLLFVCFVQEWLDDIGLPQYKEYFVESKVDGRLLNNLTLVRLPLVTPLADHCRCAGGHHLLEHHQ